MIFIYQQNNRFSENDCSGYSSSKRWLCLHLTCCQSNEVRKVREGKTNCHPQTNLMGSIEGHARRIG